MFPVGSPAEIENLVPATISTFPCHWMLLHRGAATNAIIAGHSSKDSEILLTAIGKRWYRDIRLCANSLTLLHSPFFPLKMEKEWTRRVSQVDWPRAGKHNLFAIADRITFTFMNYGRQWVQHILYFALLLFSHTEPTLLPHVCLAFFLLSTVYSCCRQRVFK